MQRRVTILTPHLSSPQLLTLGILCKNTPAPYLEAGVIMRCMFCTISKGFYPGLLSSSTQCRSWPNSTPSITCLPFPLYRFPTSCVIFTSQTNYLCSNSVSCLLLAELQWSPKGRCLPKGMSSQVRTYHIMRPTDSWGLPGGAPCPMWGHPSLPRLFRRRAVPPQLSSKSLGSGIWVLELHYKAWKGTCISS